MDAENLRISLPMIGGIALLSAGLMLWVVTRFIGLRRQPAKTGQDDMVGSEATAAEAFEEQGHVRLLGERWNARSSEPLRKGQVVRVMAVEGLTLVVEPLDKTHRGMTRPGQ